MCVCVGGGYEAIAALSFWLSKLHACRGWLPGWLPEKLVGMQGQGRGRRLLPSSTHKNTNVCLCVPESLQQLIQMQSYS